MRAKNIFEFLLLVSSSGFFAQAALAESCSNFGDRIRSFCFNLSDDSSDAERRQCLNAIQECRADNECNYVEGDPGTCVRRTTPPPPPPPPGGGGSSGVRDVIVHNYSNRQACLAVVDGINPFVSRGWYQMANGETKTFYHTYFIRAEECGNTGVKWNPGWPQGMMFCSHATNAFEYYTANDFQMCANLGAQMIEFNRIPDGAGAYEWNLTY